MKRASKAYRILRNIGICLFFASFAGGIVMGDRFRIPSYNIDGKPFMMFDMGLTFAVWLVGGLLGLLFLGKAYGRK